MEVRNHSTYSINGNKLELESDCKCVGCGRDDDIILKDCFTLLSEHDDYIHLCADCLVEFARTVDGDLTSLSKG